MAKRRSRKLSGSTGHHKAKSKSDYSLVKLALRAAGKSITANKCDLALHHLTDAHSTWGAGAAHDAEAGRPASLVRDYSQTADKLEEVENRFVNRCVIPAKKGFFNR